MGLGWINYSGHDTMYFQAKYTVRNNREIKHLVFYTVQIGVYRP